MTSKSKAENEAEVLVVDLDGTLIRNDLFREGLSRLAILRPLTLLAAMWVLISKGKLEFKLRIAQAMPIDSSMLPYRSNVIDRIKHHRAQGGEVWLATGAAQVQAEAIAKHLGLFDAVLGSTSAQNLTGSTKLKVITSLLGPTQRFNYIGNALVDFPIFRGAGKGTLVTPNSRLANRASTLSEVDVILENHARARILIQHLRVHQWAKNLLIFVPLLTAHLVDSPSAWWLSSIAFLFFSLAASAIYGLNDLSDIWNDRSGAVSKANRALAAGRIDPLISLGLAVGLIAVALTSAFFISSGFGTVLLGYILLTSFYSFKFKRVVLLDVLLLSILYLVRIVAGASVLELDLSFWILSFSSFIFFSLALLKRFSELFEAAENSKVGPSALSGRGYRVADLEMVRSLGVSSGLLAGLVYLLYINDVATVGLYSNVQVLWLGLPILTVWVSWLWLKAGRGEMHSDPIFFALKDRASLICGLLLVFAFIVAL